MTLKVEMKNIGKFLFRRKWIIIISALLFTLGVVALNMISNDQHSNVPVNNNQTAPTYNSEFAFAVENENGSAVLGLSTIKTIMINEINLKRLQEKGIGIDQETLQKSVVVFVRSSRGELLNFRIQNKDKGIVESLTSYYFNLIKGNEFEYFKNRNIYLVNEPTKIANQLPVYKDIFTSTDSSMTKKKTGTVVNSTNKKSGVSPIIGLLLGIAVGLVVAILIDIFSKKIYSVAYVESILKDNVKVSDLTNNDKSTTIKKVGIIFAQNSDKKSILLTETPIDNMLELLDEKNKIPVYDSLRSDNILDVATIFIVVVKGKTNFSWLKEQIELIDNSKIEVVIAFLDSNVV